MPRERTYNGWKNYQTWATNLWIGEGYAFGIEAVEDRAKELVKDEVDRLSLNPRGDAARALADELDCLISDQIADRLIDNPESGLERDLLGYAMAGIDWEEIARHYTAEVPLPEEYALEASEPEEVLA